MLSSSLMFVGMVLLLRSIPAFAQLFGNFIRFVLKWSYRLYKRCLTALDPFFRINLSVTLLELPMRAITSSLISILLGFFFMLLLRLHFSLVLLVLCALHGLVVGYLWTNFFEPQGLHIGEKM
jgi:hypothetical protein